MRIRAPIVAGRFYPSDSVQCRNALEICIQRAADCAVDAPLVGGIVPHAGWLCSGHVAAGVFRALAQQGAAPAVVLLGAVHRWPGRQAAIYRSGGWKTPLGTIPIAADLADELLAASDLFIAADEAHAAEHSLEVQAPFVQHFFPTASILPIMVPPMASAVAVGEVLGGLLARRGAGELVVGSTDLTHYGPSYRFTPLGVGAAGLDWAREVNDRRMIDLMTRLAAEEVVGESASRMNACGGGAVAATLAAGRRLGALRGEVIEHTTSHQVLGGPADDAVGYVGVVIAK